MAEPTFVRSRNTNRLAINPLKKGVRAYSAILDGETIAVPANTTVQATSTITQDVQFEGYRLSGLTTDVGDPNISPRLLVQIRNPWLGWTLMNRGIHFATLVGNNLNPHIFAQTMYMPGPQALVYTLQDFSGGNVTFQASMGGRQILPSDLVETSANQEYKRLERLLKSRISMPYWLTTDQPINLTVANQDFTFPMSIPEGAHFEAHYLMAISDVAVGGTTFQFGLMDTYSGKWWYNRVNNPAWIDARYAVGNAQFPYYLDEPTYVAANHKIMLSVRTPALLAGQMRIFFTIGGRIILKDVDSQ